MSILIVEDNPVNLRLFSLILNSVGYQTVVARNGNDGLRAASEMPDIQLIITDYMMPGMDGLEFIAQLRALPSFNQVPIIVASSYGDLKTVERAQALQCDGFLAKPINKKELLQRVEQLVGLPLPVLADKRKTMAGLLIGLKDYNDLIRTFAAQLATTISTVVLEQGDPDEPISENLGRLLKELAESASTLGAERFALLYSRYMGPCLPARSQGPILLKELQELETSLYEYLGTLPSDPS